MILTLIKLIMKLKNLKYLFLSMTLIVFNSCEEEDDETGMIVQEMVEITSGSADFTRVVSLGASITAGFTDNALFFAGQQNSYPNIMAGVMSQSIDNSAATNFTQPYMDDNIGGLLFYGNQITSPRLYFNGAGPAVLPATPTTEITNFTPGPYSNLGVPGAQAVHLLAPGYGNLAGVPTGLANPYFARMASSPNASVLEDAMAQAPTFVTLWSGGNDALGYAVSGGTSELTDPDYFDFAFGSTIGALAQVAPGGLVANIPDVTSIAYLNTVPYNAVPLDAGTAGALNGGFAPYNGGLAVAQAFGLITAEEVAARTITFAEGQNAVTMVDEYLTDLSALGLPSYRQATMNDKVVLTAATFIGTSAGGPFDINGVSVPLADNWVLSSDEVMETQTATAAFNATIAALTSQYGWAFIDTNAVLNEAVTQGIQFDDYTMTGDLVFGGLFSLDGVHPTARGNALIANKMMEAIDAQYGSNLSDAAVKAGDYPTNYSPTMN